MIRKHFTTHQLIPCPNTSGMVLRKDKYIIFQMEKLVLWSSDLLEGRTLLGKRRESGWGGRGEEIDHQDELGLQELNYEISEGIH